MKEKCFNNLKKCKSICCTHTFCQIPKNYKKNKRLYDLKGFKLYPCSYNNVKINALIIPSRCPILSKDNKCALEKNRKIHALCTQGYKKIKKNLLIPQNCIYYDL
jgi:hypothetical protein